MKQTPMKPSKHKTMHQDECCDLYNEYCYPCTTTTGTATEKPRPDKSISGERRRHQH